MIEIKQRITGVDGSSFEVSRQGVSLVTRDRSMCGCSPGVWRGILARAWETAGEHWHKAILPKHFTVRGRYEYRYEPRSKKHREKKLRRFGHRRPLVFTGESERKAKRIRDIRELKSGKAVRIFLHVPSYFFKFHKASDPWSAVAHKGQPNKAAELQRISERDSNELAMVIDKQVTTEANLLGGVLKGVGRGHRGAAG